MKGRLPGGVCAADDENVLASHRRSLGRCCAVEDSASDESIDAPDSDASIRDAHCQHDSTAAHFHRSCADRLFQRQDAHVAIGAQTDRLSGDEKLRTEGPRLLEGTLRQISPTDAIGKPR